SLQEFFGIRFRSRPALTAFNFQLNAALQCLFHLPMPPRPNTRRLILSADRAAFILSLLGKFGDLRGRFIHWRPLGVGVKAPASPVAEQGQENTDHRAYDHAYRQVSHGVREQDKDGGSNRRADGGLTIPTDAAYAAGTHNTTH